MVMSAFSIAVEGPEALVFGGCGGRACWARGWTAGLSIGEGEVLEPEALETQQEEREAPGGYKKALSYIDVCSDSLVLLCLYCLY